MQSYQEEWEEEWWNNNEEREETTASPIDVVGRGRGGTDGEIVRWKMCGVVQWLGGGGGGVGVIADEVTGGKGDIEIGGLLGLGDGVDGWVTAVGVMKRACCGTVMIGDVLMVWCWWCDLRGRYRVVLEERYI